MKQLNNYDEAVEVIKNISKDKVLGIVMTSSTCEVCKKFVTETLEKINQQYSDVVEIYQMDIEKHPTQGTLPVPTVPITYFYIKDCKVFPLMRPGYAGLEILEGEIKKFKLLLKGEPFETVYG